MPRSGPDFSVITPAYNAEAFVAEAIESVLAQTHGDFELIVVDDGSTDRTVEVVGRYSASDPRVRLLQQANRGVSAARNTAIRVSCGRHVALLDSDDRWMPSFLMRLRELFASHSELDVISANALNLGGQWDGQPWKAAPLDLQPVSLAKLIEVESSICITAVMKRRVAELIGGFDESLRRNEDYDFWLRAALAGCRLAFWGEPLAYYRRRADGLSGNEADMLSGIVRVLTQVKPLCVNRPDITALIDKKIDGYEKRRLVAAARDALLSRDFPAAALGFDRLHERFGGMYRLMAGMARRTPQVLLWAYAAKSSIQSRPRSVLTRH
ncbi:MAG TPA: glycosyltransferase [Vicinamibacterales bacterium]|nr:glycosyltransferase [Vicinamibacterales bacterium]